MTNKILELSKRVYDAGFEPNRWAHYSPEMDGINELFYLSDAQNEVIFRGPDYPYISFDKPYFSADWCWKVLPLEIDDSQYGLYSRKGKLGYEMYWVSGDDLIAFEIGDSLHETLLELVCWCIEQKYIQPEVK